MNNNFLDLAQNIIKEYHNEEIKNRVWGRMLECSKHELIFQNFLVDKSKEHLDNLRGSRDNVNKMIIKSYEKLEEANSDLKKENDYLMNYIEEIKLNYQTEINMLMESKESYDTKIEKLLIDLHSMQGSKSKEINQVEMKLKKEIAETNNSVKEALNTAQTLRNELLFLKESFAQYKDNMEKKVKELKCDLEWANAGNDPEDAVLIEDDGFNDLETLPNDAEEQYSNYDIGDISSEFMKPFTENLHRNTQENGD